MDISHLQSAIFLSVLVIASLFFRLEGMTESLWYDEVYRTKAIYFEKSIWKILFFDCHNFLYNAIMHIWILIFGDSEISIRIPSLIMGYASALIMQKWISDRWGRLFSVLLFSWFVFSPFHIWYSTEAKNNAMVMLFTALVFVSYDALITKRDNRSFNTAVAISVLGIYTDFLLFFPILAAWVLLCIDGIKRQDMSSVRLCKRVALWTFLLIAPMVIHKGITIQILFKTYLKFLDVWQLLLFVGNYLTSGNAIFPIDVNNVAFSGYDIYVCVFYSLSILLVIFFIFYGSYWIISNFGYSVVIYFILPIVLIMAMSLYMHLTGHKQIYLERSLASITFYFFGIILFSGFFALKTPWIQKFAIIFFIMLNILASLSMLTIHKGGWTVYKPNPDWRGVSSHIMKEDVNATSVIVGTAPLNALQYYMEKNQNDKKEIYHSDSNSVSRFLLWDFSKDQDVIGVAKSKNVPFVYIVRNVYWLAPNDNLLQQVDTDMRVKLVDQRSFFGIELYKYQLL